MPMAVVEVMDCSMAKWTATPKARGLIGLAEDFFDVLTLETEAELSA